MFSLNNLRRATAVTLLIGSSPGALLLIDERAEAKYQEILMTSEITAAFLTGNIADRAAVSERYGLLFDEIADGQISPTRPSFLETELVVIDSQLEPGVIAESQISNLQQLKSQVVEISGNNYVVLPLLNAGSTGSGYLVYAPIF